jgi:hypothetical protein
MSFLKSLFGSKTPKKPRRTYDKAGLRRIYEEAKDLFLRGKYDQALESFKSIYENDITVRDVATIIEDYFVMPKDKWIAKYKAQFRAQPPKESGDVMLAQVQLLFLHPSGLSLQAVHFVLRGVQMKPAIRHKFASSRFNFHFRIAFSFAEFCGYDIVGEH